jgi:sugar phosphate permease
LEPTALRAWRIRILLTCWVTYAAFYIGRVNLAIALPALGPAMGWSRASLGLLGSAFYWCYALGQLVNGQLGERFSARRFVALGLVVTAGLNLAVSAAQAYGLVLLLWSLNGWAQATGWGPIVKTLSRWFEPEQRGRVTALFAPCYVFGNALAWLLAGAMIAAGGWRWAFRGPGLALLGMAALWFALSRDGPPNRVSQSAPAQRMGLLGSLRLLWNRPALRWALVVCFLSGMVKDALTLWAPTYLVERYGLEITRAALTGTVIPLGGMAGAMLGGRLLSHGQRREEAVVGLMAVLMGGGALALYLAGAQGAIWLGLPLLGLVALGSHGMNALLMTAVPLSLGRDGPVSAAAGTLDFASYVGGGLSALATGLLMQRLGWAGLFGLWVCVGLAIGGMALRAARATP